jgi:hypothetical protein
MTESANVGSRPTVGQIVEMAWKYAGLLEVHQIPDTDQGRFGRKMLENILNRLVAEGVHAKTVMPLTVTLTAGVGGYTLPAKVFDVDGPLRYIPAGQSITAPTSDSVVSRLSRQSWDAVCVRSSTGVPTMAWFNRAGSETAGVLNLWPTPNEAGTVRYQAITKIPDADSDGATVRVDESFDEYLVTALAHKLAQASGLSAETVGGLFAEAQGLLKLAKAGSAEFSQLRMAVAHPTGWNS